MITDFILSTFGCPSEIVVLSASIVCPFLPLVVLYLSGKSINVSDDSSSGKLIAYIVIILYVVYACYAFMIPQALIGECY
jgi:hypothetical protein